MSFEYKGDTTGSNRVRDARYPEVLKQVLDTPATRIVEAFQQLSHNGEAPPPARQAYQTLFVDAQTFVNSHCSVRTSLAKFLERSSCKVQPETTLFIYDASDQSSAKEKIYFVNEAALEVI